MKSYELPNKAWVLFAPYAWLLVFLFLPFLFTLKMSLAHNVLGNPPFTSLLSFSHDLLQIQLYFDNYLFIFSHNLALLAFISSIKIALMTTGLCVLIGYPMAYAIAHADEKWQKILFLLIILPYWTSFLLRAYAWIILLQNNGLVNQFLQWTGLTHSPIRMIYNDFSLCVGLVYGYLPFFILPLYAVLVKLDSDLLEAAYDLGSKPWHAFLKITLPLSLPGVLAGALLVFIPCVGEVVTPQILGGSNTFMIGNVIWDEFFIGNNWGVAAALSIVMLIILVAPCLWLQKIQQSRDLT